MNNRGEVFGTYHDGAKPSALIWHFFTPNVWVESSYPDLTPGNSEVGWDINDAGYGTGYECTGNPRAARAVVWKPTLANYPYAPGVTALGPLGSDDQGYEINNVGTVVGWTMLSRHRRAWINTMGGPMKALQIGTKYSDSWPADVNDGDVVVGAARANEPPATARCNRDRQCDQLVR